MALVVQKFGGTSLADAASQESLCGKVASALKRGDSVVVVVSAMGRLGDPYATDTLLDLFSSIPGKVDLRVSDLMVSCGEVISSCAISALLTSKGIPSSPLTAYTAGIFADGPFGDATARVSEAAELRALLDRGIVPVVTGFQGVGADGALKTFGRGGSDTTAVALGAALGADYVDIFKDVPGVAKADPRIVPDAPFMDFLDYDSMFRLAKHGSRVLHDKSASLARAARVRLRVRSTFAEGEGTLIGEIGGGGVPAFIGMATCPGPDSGLLVTAVFSPESDGLGVAKAMNLAAVSGFPFKTLHSGDSNAAAFQCEASVGKPFARALFAELTQS